MEWTSSLVYRCERKNCSPRTSIRAALGLWQLPILTWTRTRLSQGSVLQDQSDIPANWRRMWRAPPALQLRDNYQHLTRREGLFMFGGTTAMANARQCPASTSWMRENRWRFREHGGHDGCVNG